MNESESYTKKVNNVLWNCFTYRFAATFLVSNMTEPHISPVVRNRFGQYLNPDAFAAMIKFGKHAGDACKWIHVKVLKGFDWVNFIFDECQFGSDYSIGYLIVINVEI